MGKLQNIIVNIAVLQEAGDEEKKEVSLALKNLRCKYDDIHMMTVEKERALQALVADVQKKTEEERIIEK